MPDHLWQRNIAEITERYGKINPAHIGPRVKTSTEEPIHEGRGISQHWYRLVYGWPYHFQLVFMPDGERRLFVSKFNGYIGGVRFGCAWSPVRSYVYPVGNEVRITSPAKPRATYDHGYVAELAEIRQNKN